MTILLQLALSGLMPSLAPAHWYVNYSDALNRSKAVDKPILAYFYSVADGIAPEQRFARLSNSLGDFVLLAADKSTAQGRKTFDLFEIEGPTAVVIVERSHQWQYCRYQRTLSDTELELLLIKTSQANGKPTAKVLPTDVAIPVSSSSSTWTLCPS